jgi:NADPH2:quinone reductase
MVPGISATVMSRFAGKSRRDRFGATCYAAAMRAMVMRALGEPDRLELMELPDPMPGPGQVAIDVDAIGCNFADILICRGGYQLKPALPFSPGAEVAGRIAALGQGVQGFREGQKVTAQLGFGGYASRVVAGVGQIRPIAGELPAADAVALGVTYLTSYLGLCDRARLSAGETVLVHAAAGGVGLAAVQIARAIGARVIAGASSDDKLELARKHGAHDTVRTSDPSWPERVRELTSGAGADVIYDSIGGEIFEQSLKCIAWAGRVLVIGFSSGEIPSVKLNRVLLKHVSIIGLHLGTYEQRAPSVLAEAVRRLAELHAAGAVRPLIHASYPLAEAPKALAELGARNTVGKLILIP